MKLDPNRYCIHYDENLFWAIVHDTIAHPLMAITLYKVEWFIRFHNYTSQKAWVRKRPLTATG